MRSKRAVAFGAVALMVLGAGCGGDNGDDGAAATTAAEAGEPGTVVLQGNEYTPETITVQVGDTVTWEWDDGTVAHDVNGGDDFKSEIKDTGTFEHTFDEAGSFEYKCTVHPSMTGTVEVTE